LPYEACLLSFASRFPHFFEGKKLPSQQQLRWSELKVGLTVIVACVTLAVLIFLMSGSGGMFSSRLTLRSYFQDTGGLRVGSPVAFQGVTIGTVKKIRVVQGRQLDPIEIIMKVDKGFQPFIKIDSMADLTAAGVLGELYVNIDSKNAKGPMIQDHGELKSRGATAIDDVVKAGQTTLQNMDTLLRRLDRILATVENGEGSVGKFIKDPALFNRADYILREMQTLVSEINSGKGSIGKLLKDDELYTKVNSTVTKVAKLVDDIDAGKGSAGKLLKDEQLYKNANETLAKANVLMTDINNGKGTLGLIAKDPEFAKKVDGIATNLQVLMSRLEAGEGSIGKLSKDPSLYNNADQMLVESRNLVKAIRENPKKYLTIHFRIF
jgi:phospholipid/cholesterol/gamma-HCH transport system substrate-binding protein